MTAHRPRHIVSGLPTRGNGRLCGEQAFALGGGAHDRFAVWSYGETASPAAARRGATPAGTSILASVRAADAIAALDALPWTAVENGVAFTGAAIHGRYIQIKMTLRGLPSVSPLLSDVTIAPSGSPPGALWTAASECASGFCVDGVCCDTACSGQCEACNVAGSEGTCVAVAGARSAGARRARATAPPAVGAATARTTPRVPTRTRP